jgi:3-deoxy-manno-octulosonate cytidylyltransferase (CMP-KDO synthetase)
MKTAIVIPARLESTRFPEKMLVKVDKTMNLIQRVHHWCCCFNDKEDVFIATDSKKIASLFPGQAIMTDPDCPNGTARVAQAINDNKLKDYDTFINVQGDMIDVPPVFEDIKNALLTYPVATVYTDMPDDLRSDPNSVKLVGNGRNAIWFARGITGYGDWHLGIYGYHRWALNAYTNLPIHDGELVESLEQLRWLYNNIPVGLVYSDSPAAEINTEEDLKRWQLTHQN